MAEPAIYSYVPHHRTRARMDAEAPGPVKVTEQHRRDTLLGRFNAWAAVHITNGVGTMWCAYLFAALALVSFPAAIRSHDAVLIVSWISQTFIQLVLLSIIMVGQNVQAVASDKRAEATYEDADAVLHEAVKIQEHLAAQDRALDGLLAKVEALR